MATFIKAGFWQRLCNPCEGYEGWLNLDWLISKNVTNILNTTPNGLYAQTADGTEITNTTSELSLIGPGVGVLSVPANAFKVGDSFIVRMGGSISTSGGNDTLRVKVKTNSTVLADSGVQSLPNLTDESFLLEVDFTIRNIGAATTAEILSVGIMTFQKSSSGSMEGFEFSTLENTTFDTTIENTLDITIEWGDADPGDIIQSRYFTLTKNY
jgi:hypothetical protein